MTTIAVGNRRLLKLAEFLETEVPRKQFDMELWSSEDIEDNPKKPCLEKGCGTTACALGWATTIPSFRKAGLKFDRFGRGWAPYFGGSHCYSAAEKFFGLSHYEAVELFSPPLGSGGRETAKQAAKRLRAFVEWRAPK